MNKKYKLSQWHDGRVMPVRNGLYECFSAGSFRYFYNGNWFYMAYSKTDAVKNFKKGLLTQLGPRIQWRGIVK